MDIWPISLPTKRESDFSAQSKPALQWRSPVLQHLGNTSFHGEISGYFTDLVMYGLFRTDIGSVQTDLKLSSDKAKALFSYSGGVKTTDFELGQLLGNKQLGKITFNLDVRGNHYKSQYPSITLKGLIASSNTVIINMKTSRWTENSNAVVLTVKWH